MKSRQLFSKLGVYPLCDRNGQWDELQKRLASHHIECIPKFDESCGSILLLFDGTTHEQKIQQFLFDHSEIPIKKILLNLSPQAIPFYEVWNWLQLGASDIINHTKITEVVDLLVNKFQRWKIIEHTLHSSRVSAQLIGSCRVWKDTLRQVIEVACFSDKPVLILGETGTGKELIARLIHDLDKRPQKEELILLDCSTLVPDLFGSEFFGHEKGSYTNAVSMREGAFGMANNGTLFLDEIGELPLALQAALLRVIQEGTYKRVGSNQWRKTNFRLVSATNKKLENSENKSFRSDLFFRISTSIIRLPSLEVRKTDIPELARHFLSQALKTDTPPQMDKQLLNYLLSRPFPGNVRELRQLINRIAIAHPGGAHLSLGCLPPSEIQNTNFAPRTWQENGFQESIRQAISDGIGLKDIKRIAGEVAMDIAIEKAAGKLPAAAKLLDVSDRMLQQYWSGKNG